MRLSPALLMRAPVTPTRYTVGIGLMGLCAPMIGRRMVRHCHLGGGVRESRRSLPYGGRRPTDRDGLESANAGQRYVNRNRCRSVTRVSDTAIANVIAVSHLSDHKPIKILHLAIDSATGKAVP